MCIILLKKKDQQFEPALVTRMAEMGNRDGFGMMWVEGERTADGKLVGNTGRVKFFKSMARPSELAELYEPYMNNNIAVHVRNATLGDKDEENCHPYCVLSKDLGHKIDLYMMHNGTIKDVQVNKSKSDSWNFAEKFLRPYFAKHQNILQDKDFQYFLCAIIGANKLLFLDSFERFTVINRDLWSTHAPTGCLVSTSSDIKVWSPPPPLAPVVHGATNVGTTTSKASGQQTPVTAWKYGDGNWDIDSDGRSHFRPKKFTHEPLDTESTDAKKAEGIDNGTRITDEDEIKKIIEKLKGADIRVVTDEVLENPIEMRDTLTYLVEESDPSQKLRSFTYDLLIAHDPEEAAKQIHLLLGKHNA